MIVKININKSTQKPIENLFNFAGSDTYTKKLVMSLVNCLYSSSEYFPFEIFLILLVYFVRLI